MELTYYTIDDLALPAKGVIRKRQSIAHFDTLAEALRHFQSLGPSMHKSLGLTDGAHTLELVRRVSFFEDDREGEDMVTLYAHNSKLLVQAGDTVEAGDILSLAGSTGRSTGPHLHFEVRINGQRVNPRSYLPT